MTFSDWLNKVIENGKLCDNYTSKAIDAKSKLSLIRLALDANGVSYLQEMQSSGFALPYEVITKEFKNYINGRYIAEYKNDKGSGYTSSIYCCSMNDIEISTTLTVILGCCSDIWVKENDFVRLYVDKNCDLTIHCPKSSRCIIDYWEGSLITGCDYNDNIELIKH